MPFETKLEMCLQKVPPPRNVTPNYEFAPPKGNNSGMNAELK